MKKIACIFGVVLLFGNCAKTEKEATGSIVGLVSDELTHELQRAKVTLTDNSGKKEATETGTDGMYEFQSLVLGQTYGVVAELSGYHPDTIITKVDGRNIRCDFVMKEIALRLSTNSIDISTGNYADFIIYNDSQRDMVWSAKQTTEWLTLNKTSGTVQAKGAEPIHITFDRSQMPQGSSESKIIINSSHEYAELTVKTMDANSPYILLSTAGIAVQKTDISSTNITWTDANGLCENSIVGGFSDWRLPTLGEMQTIYEQRNLIGGFQVDYEGAGYQMFFYWTKTLFESSDYYLLHISNGETFYDKPNNTTSSYNFGNNRRNYRCRCVRTINK